MNRDLDLTDIPDPVHKRSYVRISRFADGARIVSTFDLQPSGYLKQRDRWTGHSEGRAQLFAQLLQARFDYRILNLANTIAAVSTERLCAQRGAR